MTELSVHMAPFGTRYVPGPGTDYLQDLENVGMSLRGWRSGTADGDEPDDESPLIYRSWSDGAMGIFGTDTGASSVDIDAEVTHDLLAVGIPLGDEAPVFRLASSPFSGQGLDVFCLPRGSRLQIATRRNGLRSVAMLVHLDSLNGACETADWAFPSIIRKIRSERGLFSAKVPLPLTVQRTARAVIDGAPSDAFPRLYRRAKMAELLWLVMEHLRREDREPDRDPPISRQARDGIERVRRTIAEDPSRNATTEELGRIAGMNRTKLRSLFKLIHGVTMFEYRQAIIMKCADEMLREPDFSIAEIGYRLGYGEPSSFNIAYKRFYGRAPGQVRRRR